MRQVRDANGNPNIVLLCLRTSVLHRLCSLRVIVRMDKRLECWFISQTVQNETSERSQVQIYIYYFSKNLRNVTWLCIGFNHGRVLVKIDELRVLIYPPNNTRWDQWKMPNKNLHIVLLWIITWVLYLTLYWACSWWGSCEDRRAWTVLIYSAKQHKMRPVKDANLKPRYCVASVRASVLHGICKRKVLVRIDELRVLD